VGEGAERHYKATGAFNLAVLLNWTLLNEGVPYSLRVLLAKKAA
jgi:hypothetical protein